MSLLTSLTRLSSRSQVQTLIDASLRLPRMPCASGVRYDSTFSFGGQPSASGVAFAINTLYPVPMILVDPTRTYGTPMSLDRIGIEVTSPAAASSKARLGLALLGTDGKPGALIVDAGEVAIDAIAGVEATFSATVYSGVPFFALLAMGANASLRAVAVTGSQVGVSSLTDVNVRTGYSKSFTYGVLADPVGAVSQSAIAPRIIVRVV